jgi:hypothetical protein
MTTATWSKCSADFVFDGAWVDLIAVGTDLREWELFIAALRSGPFSLQCYRDGETIPVPTSASWALAETSVATVCLSVQAGEVVARCHFFEGDLELDIDPREVVNEAAFESLLDLMRFVANAVGRPVIAAPEGGGLEEAFLCVDPNGEALSLKARGVRKGMID